MKKIYMLLALTLLAGCFQAYSDDDEELRNVPVTNNPTLMPSRGSGFPGI